MKHLICHLLILVLLAFVPASASNISAVTERPEFESGLLSEINSVRSTPWKFKSYFTTYQSLLNGDVLHLPDRAPLILHEGASVIQTARDNIVKRGKSVELVRWASLDRVARLQLLDLLENPELGHTGKDGADLAKRVSRYGKSKGPLGENITYSDMTPRQALLTMIIDDGVASRQHRENIFKPDYRLIGIACGITDNKKSICVVVFGRIIFDNRIKEF